MKYATEEEIRAVVCGNKALAARVVYLEALLEVETDHRLMAVQSTRRAEEYAKQLETFTPTPDSVNALPAPLRKYIHALETRCDPGGDVQTMAALKENVAILSLAVESAAQRAQKARVAVEGVQAIMHNCGGPANRDETGNWICWPEWEKNMLKQLQLAVNRLPELHRKDTL